MTARNQFTNLLDSISLDAPRNPQELPGLNLWRSLRGSLLWIVLLVLFFSSIFPIMAFVVMRETGAGFREMNTAEGRVLEVSESPPLPNNAPQGHTEYSIVKYSFEVEGTTYYGSASTSSSSPFASLKPNSPLPIRYAPDKPSLNSIEGAQDEIPWAFFLLFPPLIAFWIAIMFLPLYGPALRQLMQARRVFKLGTITVGTVHFVTKNRNSPFFQQGNCGFEISYAFTDEEGKNQRGQQICDNEWLVQKLDVGSEITVVYLPQAPGKSIMIEPFIR